MKAIFTEVKPSKSNNRGKPPESFINELIAWARLAPDVIFAQNKVKNDIFASIKPFLGPSGGVPWTNLLDRKAALCEVLRVLGGYESSWDWNEGRDVKNTPAGAPKDEIETGIFQVSANSMNFDSSLKALVVQHLGTLDVNAFIEGMKKDHRLALEYTARLLRFTIKHHGPLVRSEVHQSLRRDAKAEFLQALA